MLLLARLPFLERIVGFDRLTVWHRWNGHAVIYLMLAHVVCSVWGYAKQDGELWFQEYWNWLTLPQPRRAPTGGGVGQRPPARRRWRAASSPPTTSPYPGIITATVGTSCSSSSLVTSLVVVRRKLSYEWWYAIHFTAYAGIALAWFHMIPDGNDLHLKPERRGRLLAQRSTRARSRSSSGTGSSGRSINTFRFGHAGRPR